MSSSLILKDQLISTLISTFLASKRVATQEAYKQDLYCFQLFLQKEMNIDCIERLVLSGTGEANYTILQYREFLLKKNFSPSTVNRRMGAIRSLFKIARMVGLTNIKIEVPNLKLQSYRDTKGPGLRAFKRMLDFSERQKSVKSYRDRAILRLLFDLALRSSELVNLDITDIDFEQNRILIQGKGKTQKEYLSLPVTSTAAIKRWVEVRGSDSGPLFYNLIRASKDRKRISRVGIYRLVNKLGLAVGVKTRPHGIRHLSITEACKAAQNNGFALEEVMDHSRHKSVTTLMIYRDRERDTQGAISTLVASSIFVD